jgi:hypothetical protein
MQTKAICQMKTDENRDRSGRLPKNSPSRFLKMEDHRPQNSFKTLCST